MNYDVELRGHKHTLSVEHGPGSADDFCWTASRVPPMRNFCRLGYCRC